MNMMYYALNANADVKYAAFSGEAWAEAGKVTLLGMVMVFAVLALLWGVLAVFKLLFVKNTDESKGEKKDEPKPKKVKAEPVAKTPSAPVAVTPATDDGVLIAVITAAIAEYRASEEGMDSVSANGFRVVSFKRAGRGRAWNSNK